MNTDGVARFTPSRLVLARERRGVTQRRLSEEIHVSDRMIRAYESGMYRPSAEALVAASKALAFPLQFFEAPAVAPLTVDGASFRALTKASAPLRSRAVAGGTIALEFHRFLSDRFELPKHDLPDLVETEPSAAAGALRHMWGLGQKPILNVLHLVELHGVRAFSLSEDCDAINAFSVWRDGIPFMFLNLRMTAERTIFDVAHELGHLVLHRHGAPHGQEAERDANIFAASFIMPEAAIRAEAPRLVTIATIAGMKARWRASVAALGRRLHDLNLMTKWQYDHFTIELSKRGRSNEPSPLPRESSVVLRKALAALAEEGVGLREIARELHLPVAEIRALSFGLQAIDGHGIGCGGPQGSLRPIGD
jgi:Zn-dependent peptidase ImmA (M78 family)/transcriptional regulator with XRE-family HTH domain